MVVPPFSAATPARAFRLVRALSGPGQKAGPGPIDLRLQGLTVAAVFEHDSRQGRPDFIRNLGGDTRIGLSRRQLIARHKPLASYGRWSGHDPYLLEEVLPGRLREYGRLEDENAGFRPMLPLDRLDPLPRERPDDSGKPPPFRHVPEHALAERRAVNGPVQSNDLGAEGVNDGPEPARSGRVGFVSELVDIDNSRASAGEQLGDDGFPRGDAAGESNVNQSMRPAAKRFALNQGATSP
jgi:hypothetical protein